MLNCCKHNNFSRTEQLLLTYYKNPLLYNSCKNGFKVIQLLLTRTSKILIENVNINFLIER